MIKISAFAAVAALLVSSVIAEAQVTPYEKEDTRARLLALREKPPAELRIVGEPQSERAARFLAFFRERILPKRRTIEAFLLRYYSLSLLRDSGSHRDDAEKAQWTAEIDALDEEWNALAVDPEWSATISQWAELADGLTGDLAEEARSAARERELESFPEEMKSKLDEIGKLDREWSDTIRDSPAADGVRKFYQELLTTRRLFKQGKIGMRKAQQRIRRTYARGIGDHVLGYEAAKLKGENLNRIAILRTQLAQAKGFPSWADYQLEASGQGYDPEYRGSAQQRKFLTEYLRALRPLHEQFIDQRLRDLGLEDRRTEFTVQDEGLLTPPGLEILQPYFPNEKITAIWETTLRENGFTPELLAQILVDDQARDGKNPTEAYLAGVLDPHNAYEVIEADTLNRRPLNRGDLRPGLVYILQSWKRVGLRDLLVAFHEGGHALDRLLRMKHLSTPDAYGTKEIASITSEHFVSEPDLVMAHLTPVDGKTPSREEVVRLLKNFEQIELVNAASLASASLFDLELWSIDYTAPGAPTFLQAVELVQAKTDRLSEVLPELSTPVPLFYSAISTGHYTSGGVRNIGYDFATIASFMMEKHISDELERSTGRRSWHRQPGFAKLWERVVSELWRHPFPQNVEVLTGHKFHYMNLVTEFARRLSESGTCANSLRPPPA